jgi:hypothetical protein
VLTAIPFSIDIVASSIFIRTRQVPSYSSRCVL